MLLSQDEIIDTFKLIRSHEWTSGGIALLNIGEEETVISVQPQGRKAERLSLGIGAGKTALAFFHHEPPTPDEVEAAINVVEDEVTRAVPLTKNATALYTLDSAAKQTARLAGIAGENGTMLSRENMETVFGRLAALSMGRPVSSDPIPVDARFAAALLILREVMHHLGFDSIGIL